jgi:hypothetical protein
MNPNQSQDEIPTVPYLKLAAIVQAPDDDEDETLPTFSFPEERGDE